MTAFLAWIYSVSYKVYDWFGDGYNALRNAAANAWNWAVEQAQDAYINAINYAYDLFQSIGNTVGLTAAWVMQQINNAIDNLSEDVTSLFDWVEYKFSTLNNLITNKVNQLLTGIFTTLQNLSNAIDDVFDSVIDYLSDWVTDKFGWVLKLKDKLTSLLQVFTPEKISELWEIINKIKKTILLFMDNPLVFIFDLMQSKILDFLDFVLAWGLGTIKYELPKNPPWKEK